MQEAPAAAAPGEPMDLNTAIQVCAWPALSRAVLMRLRVGTAASHLAPPLRAPRLLLNTLVLVLRLSPEQVVMKKALAHDGLARGLHESARAIERGQAQVRWGRAGRQPRCAAWRAAGAEPPLQHCHRHARLLGRAACRARPGGCDRRAAGVRAASLRMPEAKKEHHLHPVHRLHRLHIPSQPNPRSWPSWPTTATSPTTRS